VSKNFSTKEPKSSKKQSSQDFSVADSLRELLDSLSREQKRDQALIASLAFALRNFTNLHRFLELIPLIASRLVGVEYALLVPFSSEGKIWREQLQALPFKEFEELLRQLSSFHPGTMKGFGSDQGQIQEMDLLVQRHMSRSRIFSTSLIARGVQRGRLYVFDPKASFAWSDAHRRSIQLVADLTAIAIENDLIFQKIRRQESVERELNIGAEIQSQLLPDSCPIIEGIQLAAKCRPAFQVSGDYYDFIPTRPDLSVTNRDKGVWAIVIGDVMGKGVPAGLLMTMLRGMLRAEVLSGLPPDKILHDLNQLAQEDLSHSHRFVTLFYSDYDPRRRKLRFANAAHNPPLIWHNEKRIVKRLDSPGLLIGLQFDAKYGCGVTFLDPGDVILYYTDGVTEALGLAGDRFNEERLMRFFETSCKAGLSAQEILDKLFAKLDSFVGKNLQLEDDASMVLLKVNESLKLPSLTVDIPDS
tara:strand:+ start:10143 stop:11558 length:1416 start_codon:yes stop_codon:yes gene_type:complete